MATPPGADPSRAQSPRTSAASGLIARARRPAVRWGVLGPGNLRADEATGAGVAPPVTMPPQAGPPEGAADRSPPTTSAHAAPQGTERATTELGSDRGGPGAAEAGPRPRGTAPGAPPAPEVTSRSLLPSGSLSADPGSGVPSRNAAPPGGTPGSVHRPDQPLPDPFIPAVASPASAGRAAEDAGSRSRPSTGMAGRTALPPPGRPAAAAGTPLPVAEPVLPLPGPQPAPPHAPVDEPLLGVVTEPWQLPPYGRPRAGGREDDRRSEAPPARPTGAAGATDSEHPPDVHIGQITVLTPPTALTAADPFVSVAHLRRGRPHRPDGGPS